MKEKNQRIFCVFSLRNYSDDFNQKNVTDNWKFLEISETDVF